MKRNLGFIILALIVSSLGSTSCDSADNPPVHEVPLVSENSMTDANVRPEIRRRSVPNSELPFLFEWSTMHAAIIDFSAREVTNTTIHGTFRFKYRAEKLEDAEQSYLLTVEKAREEGPWIKRYLYVKMLGPAPLIDGKKAWIASYDDMAEFEADFREGKLKSGDFFYGHSAK